MRYRSLIVMLAVACVALLGAGLAWAQDAPVDATEVVTDTAAAAEPSPTPEIPSAASIAEKVVEDLAGKQTTLFAWYPDNWGQGGLYFLLGLAGALVTVYLFLGEMLPSMGGQVEYERTRITLEHYVEQREELINKRNEVALGRADEGLHADSLDKLSKDLNDITELLEKRLRSERWRLFALGFPIYLVLGGFFSAAFASNFLEALVIGFGWTLIADRLGLQRKDAQLQILRESDVNKLKNRVKDLQADRERVESDRDEARRQFEAQSDMVKQSAQVLERYAQVNQIFEETRAQKLKTEADLLRIQEAAGRLPDQINPYTAQLERLQARDPAAPDQPTQAEQLVAATEERIQNLLDLIDRSVS